MDVVIEKTPKATEWVKPKPLVIYYKETQNPLVKETPRVSKSIVTIEVSGPFPRRNGKIVPWKYDGEVISSEPSNTTPVLNIFTAAVDITDIGGFTRSGRRYTPEAAEIARKGKAKIDEEKSIPKNEVEQRKNKPVTEEEAYEFLKFIKHSEYNMVEQLKRSPARISILELLTNSEP